MAEVEIRAVSKAFKKTQAVSDLSLTVGDGEFVALARADGRRQDDDIAPRSPDWRCRTVVRSGSADAT